MTTKLKATLEAAIQKWLEETCDDTSIIVGQAHEALTAVQRALGGRLPWREEREAAEWRQEEAKSDAAQDARLEAE